MTTIYVPLLIESAEQAEALPIGTVAVSLTSEGVIDQAGVRVRGGWDITAESATGVPFLPITAWGMTALVPIEAEEEILTEDTFSSQEQLRRYVTAWQRFTSPKEGS